TAYTFTALGCGTTYTLGVEAYDAAGNHSDKLLASASASTSGCPDTQAPSVPSGLVAGGVTQTGVTVCLWSAGDWVGGGGYGRYRGGSLLSTGSGTSFAFTGLSCGTSYSLGVDAVDAAGNRSAVASVSVSTAACPGDSVAPSVPSGLVSSGVGQSGVTLSW